MDKITKVAYKQYKKSSDDKYYLFDMVFMMDFGCLWFDSMKFSHVDDVALDGTWSSEGVESLISNRIVEIIKSEDNRFYLLLSDDKILFLSDTLDGNEDVVRTFAIISPNEDGYNELLGEMHEEDMTVIYSEVKGIDETMST